MALQTIYVTRHGFRSGWLLDPQTGIYSASFRSPTGIPVDPALTAHGLDQARELGRHLLVSLEPPIERVYSSPFIRCIQTIEPFVRSALAVQHPDEPPNSPAEQQHAGTETGTGTDTAAPPPVRQLQVRCEPGLGEFFGAAPFNHPGPAPLATLQGIFPGMLDEAYRPVLSPASRGESLEALHDRVAAVMDDIIARCDKDGVRSVLLCTHAAVVIVLGRVLTGQMPDDVAADDFQAYTSGLSVYRRRSSPSRQQQGQGEDPAPVPVVPTANAPAATDAAARQNGIPAQDLVAAPAFSASSGDAHKDHQLEWRGRGVGGGWTCELNSDCSFLSHGCERGWKFSGDESFDSIEPGGAQRSKPDTRL